jgi:hypothetical protein
VEKVPLCYMTDFAWASTETRKIVKGEERIVHFLDRKQTVRQTEWEHVYSAACDVCTLRTICGGLFDRGRGYDPAELSPVFVSREAIVQKIIDSSEDPSFAATSLDDWRHEFERRCKDTIAARGEVEEPQVAVGRVTEESRRRFEERRSAEARRALRAGVRLEVDPDLVEHDEPDPRDSR